MPEKKESSYKGYTDARRKANAKYIAQFAEIKVRTSPDRRDVIKAAADAAGESVNAYINRAVEERMERENVPTAPANAERAEGEAGND